MAGLAAMVALATPAAASAAPMTYELNGYWSDLGSCEAVRFVHDFYTETWGCFASQDGWYYLYWAD